MKVRHHLRVGAWLSAILLSLSLLVSPAYAESVNLSGTILQDSNLRSGPGTTNGVIGAGRPGQAVTIIERTDAGDWYQLSTGEWIAAFLVEVQTTPVTTTAPIVEAPVAPAEAPAAPVAPVVSIGTGSANTSANLRGGPGTNFPVVGGTQTGQALTIVAKNDAGDWYQLDTGQWIAAFLVANLTGDIAVPAQPAPVQAEAAPTVAPTPQPAAPTPHPYSGQRRGARCHDGTYSGATGRGACSWHGGVAEWLYYP